MIGAVGLRTYIWNNFWKSALLLAGFPVLLAVLAFGLSLMFGSSDARGFGAGLRAALGNLPWFFGLALIVAAGWFGIAWRFNDA